MTQAIILIAIASVIVKQAVDIFKGVLPENSKSNFFASVALGILVALTFSLDLFVAMGYVAAFPYVGTVLTGILISQGSNVFNDLWEDIREILHSIKDKSEVQ